MDDHLLKLNRKISINKNYNHAIVNHSNNVFDPEIVYYTQDI